MAKNVTFYLGPAVGLSARQLTITRMLRSGDDSAPSAEVDATLAGSAESSTQELPDNDIYQAKLVDTKTTGEVSAPSLFTFTTGELQFPGPGVQPSEGLFRILSMEDLSSSSSSSSQSSSSSSSSSSQSSSSQSSSSSSSQSSSSSSSQSSSSSSSP